MHLCLDSDTPLLRRSQLPSGAFQVALTVAAQFLASKVHCATIFCTIAVQVLSLARIISVPLIPIDHRLALTACCWLLGIIGAVIILNYSANASNFAGHMERITINGLKLVCDASGSIVDLFMFRQSVALRYMSGVKALCDVYASRAFTALISMIT